MLMWKFSWGGCLGVGSGDGGDERVVWRGFRVVVVVRVVGLWSSDVIDAIWEGAMG